MLYIPDIHKNTFNTCIVHFVFMVVHTAGEGQNPPFKIKTPFYKPHYFNSKPAQKPNNWSTE